MNNDYLFTFNTDITSINIPEELNNPFSSELPEIVNIAAVEFQEFIASESHKWAHDFSTDKGKMFGILVIQKKDGSYAYLGTVSGKLLGHIKCGRFVPSVLDDSEDDFFNKGMTELTEMGKSINKLDDDAAIIEMTEKRKLKSLALQQRLFENTRFLNLHGQHKNVIEIFELSAAGHPPSAAGECAAPKLLHFAYKHSLKPIAIAEFWWGNPPKNKDREQKAFYPACKSRCRPILEYMLDDSELYKQAQMMLGKT